MPDLEIYRPRQMTRWTRFTNAVRSYTLGPWSSKDPNALSRAGRGKASAGVYVDESTAMNYSAVWSAVNLIAGDVASVPLKLYKRMPDGGKVPFDTHPIYRLVHTRPNPYMTSSVFRRVLQANKLIWGNGLAEIERDQAGRPVALWPLMPSSVQPYVDRGVPHYRVTNPSGSTVAFDVADVIHIRGFSKDGWWGMSAIEAGRESLGLGIATERFGSAFFGNGSTFGGIISYPAGVGSNPKTREENRQAIERRHTGVERAHKFLTLYEGAKYDQIGIPPNDAQFLETREFQIEEVCRWYNIQPHKLKHLKRSTNNNIEQQSIEYATDTLEPHWVDWEQELGVKLIAPLEQSIQIIEHVREGRLRGDSAARGDFYSKLFSIAAITPNEIRARENLNPIAGGDTVYVPLNTLPLDRLGEYYDAIIKEKEAPKVVTPPAPKQDDSEEVKQARKRAQDAEDARDLALENARRADEARELIEAARVVTVEQCEQRVAAAEAARELAEEAIAALATERDGVLSERDALRVASDATIAELGAVVTERDALKLSLEQVIDQMHGAVEDYQDALAARTTAEADRDAAVALALQAEQERDAARLQAEAFQQTAETAEQDAREAHTKAASVIADLTAQIVTIGTELQAEQTQRAAADASRLEMEAERDAANLARKTAEDAAVTVTAACEQASSAAATAQAERDALAVEAEALKTDTARARADLATELEKQRTQKAVLLAAMRSLFIDASERLLAKESNAARKHQATPEKLRGWVERFYELHAETAREVFRSIVGPWTAVTGGAPNLLLDRLVAEHIAQSRTALLRVAEADDADEMAASLERTLSRWEHERAETMADALVREGIGQ